MRIADQIAAKLHKEFALAVLTVVDDSEKHRGHAGYKEGGESHFSIILRAPAFGTMTRVERHRAVHAAIGPELLARIHALAVDVGP